MSSGDDSSIEQTFLLGRDSDIVPTVSYNKLHA